VRFPGSDHSEAKANIANALEAYMEVLLETAILHQATREGSVSVESSVSETTKMLVRPKFEFARSSVSLSDLPLASGQQHRRVFERKLGFAYRKNAEHIIHAEASSAHLWHRTCGIDDKD